MVKEFVYYSINLKVIIKLLILQKIKVMKSKTKFPISNRFETIKQMYKNRRKDGFDIEAFDALSMDLVNLLGECTMAGVTEIEGLHIDKWKDRVWNLIENAGLLPEYRDEEDDTKFVEIVDTWYTDED